MISPIIINCMANEPTNGELALMLKNLRTTVETGFKGMHDRQDTTNGKVMANTEFRLGQQMANRFIYGLITLLIIPTIWLVIENLIEKAHGG